MNINEELEKFVPTSEILKKPGPGGRTLSYVDRYYVISTLNRIYGADGWSSDIHIEVTDSRVVTTCEIVILGNGGEMSRTKDVSRSEVGECLLLDKYGKPNENAATEAATQAFKRAASQLGNAFGLHLYRGLEVAAAPIKPPTTGPFPPAQVAQAVEMPTPAVAQSDQALAAIAGTLTKPDYNGAIQSAMANAEASAPPQAPPAQPEVQVDLGRLAAARADVTVWNLRAGPKGTALADLKEEDLTWYAEKYGSNLDEKPNPRFEESNRAHLANIKLCLQFFSVNSDPGSVGPPNVTHSQPQREGESWPSDADRPIQWAADNSDIPF